jgi:hypothetical protein
MQPLSAQHIAASQGYYSPQLKANWSLEIALDDVGDQMIVLYSLESLSPLIETSEPIELNYANEVRYVAGRTRYQEMELRVKDFVDIGTANALEKWRRLVYNPENGSVGLPRDYKKNADLTISASNGSVVKIYKLVGVWPMTYNHGEFNMSANEAIFITCTLKYDRAVPGAGFSGLGSLNAGVLVSPL